MNKILENRLKICTKFGSTWVCKDWGDLPEVRELNLYKTKEELN